MFISRVKTAATRLQEVGHKLDDLYIGFQLIRWLPQEFQSTVQQIYRWKEEDFRVVKIEAELILEANRLQLMKQDLEKAENAYLSSFTSKKSKTFPGATAAAHGDPNGKNDYQKKGGKVFNCKTIKNVKQSIKTIGSCYVCNKYGHLKVNFKEKKSLQKSPSTVNETFNTEFDKGDKEVWVIDTAATSHFCNDKSLFLDLKSITNMKISLATEDKSCPVEGIGTLRFRVKYKGNFHEITLTDVLFNPKLRINLLSGSRLESKGAHFVGTKDTVIYMKQPTGYEIDNNKVYSDFATNRDDRVSMGGFITFIDETPISWRTFKQKSVSLSTMEAEYVSLTEAAKEFIWLKNIVTPPSPLQVRHETGGKRNILQPPAPGGSAEITQKIFGPTDLTSAYTVCTRKVFGSPKHGTQAFRSEARCSNHEATRGVVDKKQFFSAIRRAE
ncbi:retrovirus-related Pol polyprotein from transposon RE1 [Trichonephila clavipes]|uniref:Retrovirus-related Pol polyprotein from transposon RE1 n=1 Tax=Trichonephila clavipes TaxID=2585209 RepID=A0A8X6VW50_TRICX|nr:retrovirus-related Pol polyprotein from transposon RE1 [Trichonephila clavipes]